MIVGKPAELITKLVALMQAGDVGTYELKEHREKRTLSQNAYYWRLVGETARVLKLTNTELHNQMLADYGFMDEDVRTIIMGDEIDWRKVEFLHLKPTTRTKMLDNGRLYRVYYVMRGSHTYNTKEMSRLVDGMVQEAQQQGIETIRPRELEEIRAHERELEERRRRRNGTLEGDTGNAGAGQH